MRQHKDEVFVTCWFDFSIGICRHNNKAQQAGSARRPQSDSSQISKVMNAMLKQVCMH